MFLGFFHVKSRRTLSNLIQRKFKLTDILLIDRYYQFGKTANRSSTNESRSTAIRVVEIVPVRVVEIVPVRVLPLTVVEMVPVLVVEMVPLFVVEMVPVFPKVATDRAVTNNVAQTNDFRFFISLLLSDFENQGSLGRLGRFP